MDCIIPKTFLAENPVLSKLECAKLFRIDPHSQHLPVVPQLTDATLIQLSLDSQCEFYEDTLAIELKVADLF